MRDSPIKLIFFILIALPVVSAKSSLFFDMVRWFGWKTALIVCGIIFLVVCIGAVCIAYFKRQEANNAETDAGSTVINTAEPTTDPLLVSDKPLQSS